jgi:hypothetical protein
LVLGGFEPSPMPLIRDDGAGTVTLVHGTMVGPSPIPVTIVQAEVTALVITFQVPRARPVTFGRGHLDVSVAIDEQDATGSNATIYGIATDPAVVTVGASLPADLAAALPAHASTGTEVGVVVELTAPWTLQSTSRACAPGAMVSWSSTYAGLAAMFEEYAGGAPIIEVCVMTFPGLTAVSISLTEFGTPQGPGLQALGLGSEELMIHNQLLAHLPPEIFDGETLDLAALSIARDYPAFFFATIADLLGETYYDLSQSGTLAVHIMPQL